MDEDKIIKNFLEHHSHCLEHLSHELAHETIIPHFSPAFIPQPRAKTRNKNWQRFNNYLFKVKLPNPIAKLIPRPKLTQQPSPPKRIYLKLLRIVRRLKKRDEADLEKMAFLREEEKKLRCRKKKLIRLEAERKKRVKEMEEWLQEQKKRRDELELIINNIDGQ